MFTEQTILCIFLSFKSQNQIFENINPLLLYILFILNSEFDF